METLLLAVTLLLGCHLPLPVTPLPLPTERAAPPTTPDVAAHMTCTRTVNRTSDFEDHVQIGVPLLNHLLWVVNSSLQTMRTERFQDPNYEVVTETEDVASLCSWTFQDFLTKVYERLQNVSLNLAALEQLTNFSVPQVEFIQTLTDSLKINVQSLAHNGTTLEATTASPIQQQRLSTWSTYELDRSTLRMLTWYQSLINSTRIVYTHLQMLNSEAETE
ncbi:PREDICTED: uncharacterized protein LOC109483278 [Branchiostoma belcheri]|uniref:Uncharacterized protein LOC109483278 n=1 Tax=Branchiostoma belcheri TaxID=7741 RepID=A0A6P5A6E3_BRABE|nr:PREDICTED: uncharacterized protein LOC109483278 [Branchiostoma belcheri]